MSYVYRVGQELPALGLDWLDKDRDRTDYSTGWTFTLTASLPGSSTALLTKTTGITGASTQPNITIAWAASDWSGLGSVTGTDYVLLLTARRTADSLDRVYRPDGTLRVKVFSAVA